MHHISIQELEKEAEKRGVAIHVLITEMCEKAQKKKIKVTVKEFSKT